MLCIFDTANKKRRVIMLLSKKNIFKDNLYLKKIWDILVLGRVAILLNLYNSVSTKIKILIRAALPI